MPNSKQLIDETFYNTQSMLMPLVGMLENVFFRCKNEPHFTMEYISNDCLQLTGYKAEDLMQNKEMHFADVIHPNDIEDIWTKIQEDIAIKKAFKLIFRIITVAGLEKWVLMQGEGEFSSDNTIPFLNGFLIDITDRKNALEELQKPKRFYESILETMPVELFVLGAEQRYIFCNKMALNNTEYRKWIIGKTDLEYCKYRGHDESIAAKRLANIKTAILKHIEVESEEITQSKDGSKKYHLRRYSPIFDDANILKFIIGYGFDITERRLAEEKLKHSEFLLKSINANVADGIYRYSLKNGFLYVNNSFAKMFGYTSYKDIVNADNHFFDDTGSLDVIVNSLSDTDRVKNKECLLKKRDGNSFWVILSCTKMADNHGDIYYDGVIADITEQKKAEELLLRKNTELEQANDQLDKFIYSVSHDLRSPLSSILGIIKIVEKGDEDKDELLGFIKMIKKSVTKLDKFVEDILDYYRNSRGEIKTTTIDFKRLIEESLECFMFLNGADKIETKIRVKNSKTFASDSNRIRIILNNIIGNAIKYYDTEKEKPYLIINVEARSTSADIVIEDNGKGICGEHIDKIFDMFYRATNEVTGSGLGLYIVKEAVEKIKGTIKVESTLGVGTKFIINIPSKNE
jgi:PAS domain S-box-containing protein